MRAGNNAGGGSTKMAVTGRGGRATTVTAEWGSGTGVLHQNPFGVAMRSEKRAAAAVLTPLGLRSTVYRFRVLCLGLMLRVSGFVFRGFVQGLGCMLHV